ncbi:hypothetical protein EV421DRAFT_1740657 [Armillaria borealis]|uniref:Uncharacterized protein n=1 Tax=Armillaria borealis TaxID=47425 RepID=A0AA39J3C2_9AGAR|nr:hypothetical protein EV421DRAFT_1740657 [Armillaria borealis]
MQRPFPLSTQPALCPKFPAYPKQANVRRPYHDEEMDRNKGVTTDVRRMTRKSPSTLSQIRTSNPQLSKVTTMGTAGQRLREEISRVGITASRLHLDVTIGDELPDIMVANVDVFDFETFWCNRVVDVRLTVPRLLPYKVPGRGCGRSTSHSYLVNLKSVIVSQYGRWENEFLVNTHPQEVITFNVSPSSDFLRLALSALEDGPVWVSVKVKNFRQRSVLPVRLRWVGGSGEHQRIGSAGAKTGSEGGSACWMVSGAEPAIKPPTEPGVTRRRQHIDQSLHVQARVARYETFLVRSTIGTPEGDENVELHAENSWRRHMRRAEAAYLERPTFPLVQVPKTHHFGMGTYTLLVGIRYVSIGCCFHSPGR